VDGVRSTTTNDIKVDWEFFRVASDEYRKVRNTIASCSQPR